MKLSTSYFSNSSVHKRILFQPYTLNNCKLRAKSFLLCSFKSFQINEQELLNILETNPILIENAKVFPNNGSFLTMEGP